MSQVLALGSSVNPQNVFGRPIDTRLCPVVLLEGPSAAVGVSKSRVAGHRLAPKPHHVTLGGIDWCMDFISERNMT